MITLLGFVCFFSHAGCMQPTVFQQQFDTMKACEAMKAKIQEKVDPVDWIDAKLECVEGQDVI